MPYSMLNNLKRDFVVKFTQIGPDRFYRFLLSSAILKLAIQVENPEKFDKLSDQELMDYYDKFLIFYRRENEEVYLEIAKLCRKAGHKIYRELRRQNLVEKNSRFLNIL